MKANIFAISFLVAVSTVTAYITNSPITISSLSFRANRLYASSGNSQIRNASPSDPTYLSALKFLSTTRKLKKLADEASQEDASKMINLSAEKLSYLFERADRIERAILKSQLKLVQSIALQHKDMGWTLGDLVEEGLRGVQNAILQFDPEKGTSFGAFATSMIKAQIRNAVSSASLISTSKKVKNLVQKVRTVQTAMKSRLGRSATDEELAAEMGIPMDRFEVVRRALAVERTDGDKTPYLREVRKGSPVQFDESTWERVVEQDLTGSAVSHAVSPQPVPGVRAVTSSSSQSMDEVKDVFRALNTLPKEEARAIYKKLGLVSSSTTSTSEEEDEAEGDQQSRGKGVTMKKQRGVPGGAAAVAAAVTVAGKSATSSSSIGGERVEVEVEDEDEDELLFQKALKTLRSRVLDPNYPEVQKLINLLQLARQSDVLLSGDESMISP